MNKQNKWEDLSRKMHEWYLEATKELNPESYNAKAQKSYDDLTEEQKQIDRYIANKVIQLLSSQLEEVEKEIESKYGKYEHQSGSFGYQGIVMGIKSIQTEGDQMRDKIIKIMKEKFW